MKRLIVGLCVVLVAVPAAAEIYKYVDDQGRIHFSDKPISQSSKQISVFDSEGGSRKSASQQPKKESQAAIQINQAAPTSIPEKHLISADDYDIKINVSKRGGEVIASGRIERGPACEHLAITIFVRSDEGGVEQLHTVVDNAGGFGSKIFEAQRTPYPNADGKWYISSLYAKCQ